LPENLPDPLVVERLAAELIAIREILHLTGREGEESLAEGPEVTSQVMQAAREMADQPELQAAARASIARGYSGGPLSQGEFDELAAPLNPEGALHRTASREFSAPPEGIRAAAFSALPSSPSAKNAPAPSPQGYPKVASFPVRPSQKKTLN
jgi:hypothetical protein